MIMALTNSADKPYLNGNFLMDLFAQSVAIRLYCTLEHRHLYQCHHCHHQTSATCGTIFDSTKLPLSKWFLAIHLMTQLKTAVSALELKRQLKVSYNTAWSMKQKDHAGYERT